jgi:hypothetical protein
LTLSFQICPELFVLTFCRLRRNSFPPLDIKEPNIFAIDPVALLRCWIGTGNFEITTLHEVVIGVAAARLAAARKSCVAVRRATALVRQKLAGLAGPERFDALFEIPG